jgi:ornithine cyclodeaminase/alanine dehydrogenase-like protein (mu-crystallin family)
VSLPFIDGATLARRLSWTAAADALESALRSGLDPAATPPRSAVRISHGSMLTMPAESATGVGVKLLTVGGPDSPAAQPRIQGVYVLFDGLTLAPMALLDGPALTDLRTAANSAVAARHLAPADASTLVVFGAGPQARAHILALSAVRPLTDVLVVGRRPERISALIESLAAATVTVKPGTVSDVERADIVVCATTARDPLFLGSVVPSHACIVAIGSHEADARETDDALLRRAARVVVEDRATALREAGDIVQAVAARAITPDDLIEMKDMIDVRPAGGISVFKGVGMGWQDLVVAEAAYRGL